MNETPEIDVLLEEIGIGAVESIQERRGHVGSTCRIHDVHAGGRRLVAKITSDPAFHERATREFLVLQALASRLDGLIPRFVAGTMDEKKSRTIVLMDRVDGKSGDSIVGSTPEMTKTILDRMSRSWRIGHDDVDLDGLDLPNWGRGTDGPRPHRRRAARFVRRGHAMLERFPESTPLHAPLLSRIADRFEAIAEVPGAGPPRLIHGDLHLDNVVFTTDGPRVLDWQTASIGDPVDDVVRLAMESHPDLTVDALVGLCDLHPESRSTPEHLARRTVLAYAGLVSGLAGRPDLDPASREHRLARRLLAPGHAVSLVTTALDLLEER
ncbi:MAG: aminoglycoside phosphotransferase family protein [Phycisphaera sp.]|nr:aminoglycoside phosphotransferase family protein [Phycisphaera sp.]